MAELSKNIEHLRNKSSALPRKPGVYIMENENGKVIYVGKSRSLRDRVSQYFHGAHDIKTSKMASSVYDFRFIVCDTEMEALALENSLIKQYTPKYNIKLKDAKSYPYVKIDIKSDWPRITMDRKRVADGSLFFGPYSSTSTVYDVIGQVEKTLKIPSCKRKFPEDIGKGRPCINYQIGRCMGVCRGNIENAEYRHAIERAAGILRGETKEVISGLTEEMLQASDLLEFEKAAKLRDTIDSLKKLGETQKAVGSPDTECDVIGLHITGYDDGKVKFKDAISVFYIRNGYIADSEQFIFGYDEITENESEDESPIVSFITALYQSREFIPGEILLSFEISDSDCSLLEEYLSGRAGHRVRLRTPKRGGAKNLCEMAVSDAARHSENVSKRERDDERTLVALASLLSLETVPERIEAYDVSNLGNENIMCGMVVAVGGKLKKSEYRSFNMKTVDTQDDYASMAEAINRRLKHIGAENDSMSAYPDLILLDGGAEHVSAMRRMTDIDKYSIPVFGMVKDEHHKTRTLVNEEGEIDLSRRQDIFRFIYSIQEEVHNYSVKRMSGAKRKTLKTSSLEKIKGIGKAKAKILLGHFKNIGNIKKASIKELSEVRGISASDAEQIHSYFRTEQESTKK